MINSDNPPKTVQGMLNSILNHADSHELTKNVLNEADKMGLDDIQTMTCLAYAALCSLEHADKILIDLHNDITKKTIIGG